MTNASTSNDDAVAEETVVMRDVVKEETISYTEPLTGKPRVKQGHKCCGGCCDVRRATIIVNTVSACLNAISALVLFQYHIAAQQNHMNTTSVVTANPLPFAAMISWLAFRVAIYIAGAFGGMIFDSWLVGAAILEYVLDFVFFVIQLDIPGAVMVALFAYPNVVFVLEVRKGIMSKENYHNEEHSCCCV